MSQIDITQVAVEIMTPFVETPVIPGIDAVTFDLFEEGENVDWYVVGQLSDSGDELRDKVVKSTHVTGKLTDASFGVFAYGPDDDIDVAVIESGNAAATTGAVALTDSAQVTQTERHQVNVPNTEVFTVRVEGVYDGTGVKDRVDEIVTEIAEQGIKR